TANTPKTSAIFSNVTLVGPKVTNADVVNSNYRRALHLRRNTETSLYNSIVMGWPGTGAGSGIFIDANSTADNAMSGKLQIRNVILAGKDTVTTNATNGFNAMTWFDTPAFGNTRLTNAADVMLLNPFNLTNPDFRPASSSPALSGADFTNTRLTDAFFTPTTFRGAFGSGERWDAKWANYNPQYSVNSILSDVKVKQNAVVPMKYMLEQNYPNPFNPATQIKYALPKAGHVTLKLYDVVGREVATLVDQAQTAGEFTITFNAAGLSTGIYFYRLKVGDYSEVKRLAFVK
ncbi:MAG: T9SS type A sorting domain-containing protein, partial [candidate division KSB1 bacterium]|nr:T9SS type A sorting domain-containing protein [candidate division KSB1 bacterium]MDZ7405806.1 T9SS type A sorting domain-containing protein [candidate division KSB1 bacterium]